MDNSKSINKKKCAQALSEYMNWTQKESVDFIEKCFDWIKSEILKGNKVIFPGFGVFKSNKRKGKRLIHPVSKKVVLTKEKWAPHFTTSVQLTKQINKKELK